jgi:hypothetical protein
MTGLTHETEAQISIALPDGLYLELQQAAAAMQDPGYTATHFATDVVASELASRRLSRVAQGRYGARVIESAPIEQPEPYRLMLPERVNRA